MELVGAPATPPATALSFDFFTNQTGLSGGSPRLVMLFIDGGRIELRPLTRSANTWTTVDGSQNLWGSNGGSCGFEFGVTYEAALACHAGATVTDAFIVSDSGFLYEGGYINAIDNIVYGEDVITEPIPVTCNGLEPTIIGSGRIVGGDGNSQLERTDRTGGPFGGRLRVQSSPR